MYCRRTSSDERLDRFICTGMHGRCSRLVLVGLKHELLSETCAIYKIYIFLYCIFYMRANRILYIMLLYSTCYMYIFIYIYTHTHLYICNIYIILYIYGRKLVLPLGGPGTVSACKGSRKGEVGCSVLVLMVT